MEARKTARALLASFVLAAMAAQAFVGVVEARTSPMEKASQGTTPRLQPRARDLLLLQRSS
jgi:hypothetical protein